MKAGLFFATLGTLIIALSFRENSANYFQLAIGLVMTVLAVIMIVRSHKAAKIEKARQEKEGTQEISFDEKKLKK